LISHAIIDDRAVPLSRAPAAAGAAMTPRSRDVVLERTFNLRDLGGYRAAGGATVAWGRLYRGAGLHRLAGADAERVGALGLRTAVDLRTAAEIASRGGWPLDALAADARRLPLIPALWDDAARPPTGAPADVLGARYDELLAAGGPALAQLVELLAEPARLPLVFYCAAGKDRTGIAAAIVLGALGVGADDVVADYALSTERVARMAALAGRAPAPLSVAPPQVMRRFLARIERRHGSVERLLRSLGVTDATLAALRGNLLVR